MIRHRCPIRRVTPKDDHHYFFGYYDRQPWCADESILLCHRADFVNRFPRQNDVATIGVIDIQQGDEFRPLASTSAWNWQQGSQLQWLGRPGEQSGRYIYNDRRADRLVAVIADVDGETIREIEHPVYAISNDGQTAFSPGYARLTHLHTEYGYAGLIDANATTTMPEDDGLWKISLDSGHVELLLSIRAAAAHRPNAMGAEAFHFINHVMLNPSGTRCCFLHRFMRSDGIMHSRLLTIGVDGSGLRLLMEGMVSHYHWRDDQTILAWAGRRALLGTGDGARSPLAPLMTLARRTLKPIYYALGRPRFLMNRIMRDSYLLIPDEEDARTSPFAAGELTCDGHCTYSDDRQWVITDGYTDMKNRQPLFLWNCHSDAGFEIGRYPTPASLDGPTRVDLHPRFNHDATSVCIDSAMDGSRAIYLVDISELVNR